MEASISTGTVSQTANPRYFGDAAAFDHAAGGYTLTVAESVEFNDEGGFVVIGESTAAIEYVRKDPDTHTLDLATALPSAVEAGTPIWAWDPTRKPGGARAVEYRVTVDIDGAAGGLDFTLPHELIPLSGVQYLEGASVRVDGDSVVEVLGREPVVDGSVLLTPAFEAYLPASISTLDNAWTPIKTWTPVLLNPADAWGYDSATGRVWSLLGGAFLVTAAVPWDVSTSGTRQVRVMTSFLGVERQERPSHISAPAATGAASNYLTVPVGLFPNQQLWIEVVQTSGSALQVRGGSNVASRAMFSVVRLGG